MKDTRAAEINRVLAERRAIMERRIRTGRILLIVWLVFAVLNMILLFGTQHYRLFFSCTTADFLVMIRFLYPSANATVAMLPLAMLPLAAILAAIIVWKRSEWKILRTCIFVLLWVDVICAITTWLWNPAILFGENGVQHLIAICNLLFHFALIWWVGRARRAVTSLEVLPETEYEGDPFAEFAKHHE